MVRGLVLFANIRMEEVEWILSELLAFIYMPRRGVTMPAPMEVVATTGRTTTTEGTTSHWTNSLLT